MKVVQKINTYFMLHNSLPKIVPFMGQCRKIRCSWTGRRWWYV